MIRIAATLALATAGCGMGAGVVALQGATTKHAITQTGTGCQTTSEPTYDWRGRSTGTKRTTTCDSYGPVEAHDYDPNWMHFGVLIGLKEGYAWGSYATNATTSGSASGRTIEPYFDVNFQLGRFGLALEVGWAGHSLDQMTGLSYGSWPLGLLGMMAAGPFTVFGGLDLLTGASLSNSTSLDADLGGYRAIGGVKVHAIALWDDKIDLYPRVELQSTHASADGGLRYSGTSLDFTIELGF